MCAEILDGSDADISYYIFRNVCEYENAKCLKEEFADMKLVEFGMCPSIEEDE